MLVMDQDNPRVTKVRSALSFVVYPILSVVNLPFEFFAHLKDSAISYSSLREENKHLKEQQFISDAKLLKFAALEKENIRLRSLLQSSYKIGEQVLVAEILSVNLVPFDHVVLVNKGSRFGLHLKQPVLDAQGVVGQVVRTSPLTSEVMLITDPNHAIPVQINRNGLRTIAVGTGQLNRLILPFLPNNADVQPGDLLITSGMGGTFPQGYPVAIVDRVEAQPHRPFALISATPKAALDKIREVLIVWSDSRTVPLNPLPANNEFPASLQATEDKAAMGKGVMAADEEAAEKNVAIFTSKKTGKSVEEDSSVVATQEPEPTEVIEPKVGVTDITSTEKIERSGEEQND